MEYTTITNLKWNKEHSIVECIVCFETIGAVPFAAVPYDNTEHGREIYSRCISGEFGPIAEYVTELDEGPQPESPPLMSIPVSTPGEIL